MKSILISNLTLLFLASTIYAQTIPPKREFRSVWIATVTNIDWPSSKYLSPSAQRTEFINILNKHKLNGMNAVVTQIRPSCDAFYQSSIEPWSEWLTGTQGAAPNPFYDPLIFMIDEAHKRGMEFHAWFNPYRAVVNKNTSSVSSSHVSVVHPDWIREYGNLKLLDPGLPQVREYVTKVIMDVVRRYDIDGVHFDDYFYPYPQAGVVFQDSATFANYPNGFTNKDDWRRNNVNLLIQMLSDSIKSVKPYVKFGISPFAIWKNQSSDPLGSATAGFESYSGIYADSRKWMQQGWLDYINPQIYWYIGYSIAAYDVLVEWWSNNYFGKHFYTGNAAYKIGSSSPSAWLNPSEMPNQVRLNRTNEAVKGMNFFSSKSITNNLLGIQDSLRNNLFKYPALVPVMKWIDSIPPDAISNLNAVKNSSSVLLTWNKPIVNPAKYFIIYRFDDSTQVNINDPRNILAITINDTTSYLDTKPIAANVQSITYAVTSLDRIHNETPQDSSNTYKLNLLVTVEQDGFEKPNKFELMQNYPNPFNPSTKIKFTVPHSLLSLGEGMGVRLIVYDILGNQVATLVDEWKDPGEYEVEFNASKLSSGIYYYQLRAGDFVQSKKMQVIK